MGNRESSASEACVHYLGAVRHRNYQLYSVLSKNGEKKKIYPIVQAFVHKILTSQTNCEPTALMQTSAYFINRGHRPLKSKYGERECYFETLVTFLGETIFIRECYLGAHPA